MSGLVDRRMYMESASLSDSNPTDGGWLTKVLTLPSRAKRPRPDEDAVSIDAEMVVYGEGLPIPVKMMECAPLPTSNSIEIRSADPSWPGVFLRVADELATLLGPDAQIEHIGSTAVAGLAAKPIIDVLIGVTQADEVSNTGQSLIRLGFVPGKASKPGASSAFFSRHSGRETPPINVHLTVARSREWHDFIRFRAALQGNLGLIVRYEALKCRLAVASGGDLDVYTAGKAAFVAEVLEAAHG